MVQSEAADDPRRQARQTFGALLEFHIERNTRPPSPSSPKRWTRKEFATAVGVSGQAVSQWISGATCPRHLGRIPELLFGKDPAKDTPEYRQWRLELEQSHKSAQRDDSTDVIDAHGNDLRNEHRTIEETNDTLDAVASYEQRRTLALDLDLDYETTGPRRFSPRKKGLKFVGRLDEQSRLLAFLDTPPNFSWWLVTGGAGSGKTRLARHLCLQAIERGWHAGFLPDSEDAASLKDWNPHRPTLIIVDYPTRRANRVRLIAERLRSREGSLRHSVRMLLLEREVDRDFEQAFLLNAGKELLLGAAYRRTGGGVDPLELGDLSADDIWTLVKDTAWRDIPRSLAVSKADFLDRLYLLDEQARPLTAMLLADAIASNRQLTDFMVLSDVLTAFLERERQSFWPTELQAAAMPFGACEGDLPIAFATATGGFAPVDQAVIREHGGPTFPLRLLLQCARAVGTDLTKSNRLPPLEPDLIGEFFTLEVLASPYIGTFDGDSKASWFARASWQAQGANVRDFFVRCRQTFPNHPSLTRFNTPVTGVVGSYLCFAESFFDRSARKEDNVERVVGALRPFIDGDKAARAAFANLVAQALSIDGERVNDELQLRLTEELRRLTERYTDEPDLRFFLGLTTFFVSMAVTTSKPLSACTMVANLGTLVRNLDGEQQPRRNWLESVTYLMLGFAHDEPGWSRELRGEIARLSAPLVDSVATHFHQNRDDAELGGFWVGASMYWSATFALIEPRTLSVIDEVTSLMPILADRAQARRFFAHGTKLYIRKFRGLALPARRFEVVCNALAEIQRLCLAYIDDNELIEEYVHAVTEISAANTGEVGHAQARIEPFVADLNRLRAAPPSRRL